VPSANGVANPVRPAGVLVATNAALPAGLQRFEGRGSFANASLAADMPRIAFPVDGATLQLSAAGGYQSLPLEASGGKMPLLWLVNGKPVDSMPFRRKAEWEPDGGGAARITVIDATGQAASAEIWIK
jgi:penicillin-binding protein 1C